MTTTPPDPGAHRYDDAEIERMTDFGVEITPDEWIKEFNRLGRDEMASDYAIVYGLDFMANAPAIIRQLRSDVAAERQRAERAEAERDAARAEIECMGRTVQHEITRAEKMSEAEYPKAYIDGRYRTAIEIYGKFHRPIHATDPRWNENGFVHNGGIDSGFPSSDFSMPALGTDSRMFADNGPETQQFFDDLKAT